MPSSGRTWLVCVDGSNLGYSGIDVACSLMDIKDKGLVMFVDNPRDQGTGHLAGSAVLASCRQRLNTVGANPHRWTVFDLPLDAGRTIAQTVLHQGNHKAAMLVIGSAGKGVEASGKAHPQGNPPMGSTARQVQILTDYAIWPSSS